MADNTSLATQDIKAGDHQGYMRLALSLATKSPLKPSNYRVGALVLDTERNEVLATGYTLELPGNTHAEQCCFRKLAEKYAVASDHYLSQVLPDEVALYTTVEPCSKRLSGNLPCVDRILAIGGRRIKTVYVGVREPEKFVSGNSAKSKLEGAGVGFVYVEGLEKEILDVATAGHHDQKGPGG